MVIENLECNYKCGTPFTLAFHYKVEYKDKIDEDGSLSGICISEIASSSGVKSSSNSNSNSNSISSSISNSNSNSNSKSNSNSNSRPEPSPKPKPQPNPKPNPEPNSTYTNVKFDIKNKICNKCKLIKQITSFGKKKSICKECNSK